MTTAICTLFEGDYHHGVATLVNSLVRNGYRGQVFAGYRGPLPAWSSSGESAAIGSWKNARRLGVHEGCEVVFLPLATDAHFANIKPDFMLSLFDQPDLNLERLFYLDPDICVTRDWRYFIEWASCGVALCEDVNSPIAEHHPRRVGWRRHFGPHGIDLAHQFDAYVNSGCVGVARRDIVLLENWKVLTRLMGEIVGSLSVTKVGKGSAFSQTGFGSCFDCTDQDTLNAAMQMTRDTAYSVLPRSAMGFAHGELVLPHALGPAKPWRRRYLLDALKARGPSPADKAFWTYADGPVKHMANGRIQLTRAAIKAASALARVYRQR